MRTAAARVRGLDVHPVAVIIARVTWLLALGDAVREREGPLHVPVYLGDAMQWNLSQIGELREVMLPVLGEGPPCACRHRRGPGEVRSGAAGAH